MVETNATKQVTPKKRFMDIPELRRIAIGTCFDCLKLGLRDFIAAPKYGLFFGGFYAIGGWLVLWLLFIASLQFLAYPTAIGFAFIAPFVATGIYEVSRRIEKRQPLSFDVILGTVLRQKDRDMGWMALVTGFAFFIWVNYAAIVYLLFFGLKQLEFNRFVEVLTTMDGLKFLMLGNFVGVILGIVVFSVGVVSFPLLLDREIDFATAMTTSVKAVMLNPIPMIVWATLVSLGLIISWLTFLIALPVILPVIGHASWHLYRKVVASAPQAETVSL